ncbi:MAG: co-chaperone GroES [Pedobacter sp.]|uniref:co-chaperone GroES n=1 Tax=Pedobacter sp. JCM 36344 TaxID=3374280 RepID=UPI0019BD679E|nr:co-chaperone GroES [Pedobacter sp.]
MALNFKPNADRVVVETSAAEERTASGLYIPDTAKEKPQQGTVVAVGPGRSADHTGALIVPTVQVGDLVLYSKYGGTEITIEGKEYLIMRETDILGTL